MAITGFSTAPAVIEVQCLMYFCFTSSAVAPKTSLNLCRMQEYSNGQYHSKCMCTVMLLCSCLFWKHSHGHEVCFLSTLDFITLFILSVAMTLPKVGCLSVKCIFIYYMYFQCFMITATRVSRQVLKWNLLRKFLAYSCCYCCFNLFISSPTPCWTSKIPFLKCC